jgi:DNA-binding Lrp family transcriptional regulator
MVYLTDKKKYQKHTVSAHTNMARDEKLIDACLGGKKIIAFLTLRVDTKEVEHIASKIVKFDCVEELLLVTGDTDLIARVRFENYNDLKEFVDSAFQDIYGIKEKKVFVVVNTYKGG